MCELSGNRCVRHTTDKLAKAVASGNQTRIKAAQLECDQSKEGIAVIREQAAEAGSIGDATLQKRLSNKADRYQAVRDDRKVRHIASLVAYVQDPSTPTALVTEAAAGHRSNEVRVAACLALSKDPKTVFSTWEVKDVCGLFRVRPMRKRLTA